MRERLRRWSERWRLARAKGRTKTILLKRIRQLEVELDNALDSLQEEKAARSTERDERIDRERMLQLQVRELEEQVAVNKVTIENLTYETTRNRERLRAEVAVAVRDRRFAIEGENRAQLSDHNTGQP